MRHREEWGCGHTWYRDIRIRHFGDPADIKLEHFTSEVPKSQNATHPLRGESRARDFGISGIDISAVPRTKSRALDIGNPEEGCGHGEKRSHGPRCGPRANQRLKLFSAFRPIGFRGIEEPRTSTQGFAKSRNLKSNCWLGRRGEDSCLVYVGTGRVFGKGPVDRMLRF
jgi:hypothetical protein